MEEAVAVDYGGEVMDDQWCDVLRLKLSELRLIGDWAAMVGYGDVRDCCQRAIASLQTRLALRVESLLSEQTITTPAEWKQVLEDKGTT
jgi:hypothetical protein